MLLPYVAHALAIVLCMHFGMKMGFALAACLYDVSTPHGFGIRMSFALTSIYSMALHSHCCPTWVLHSHLCPTRYFINNISFHGLWSDLNALGFVFIVVPCTSYAGMLLPYMSFTFTTVPCMGFALTTSTTTHAPYEVRGCEPL